MRPRTDLFFIVLLAAMCHNVTSSAHEYLLANDVITDDLSEENDADFGDMNSDDIRISDSEKRAQLSLTGGLRSLADMVYSQGRHDSERAANKQALLSLGKRNWRLPVYNFGRRLNPNILRSSYPSAVTRRRSQQLSVSGPLSALAKMLAVEGRRRKQSESFNNRLKLLEIGKRSSGRNQFESNDIDLDTFGPNYL